MLRTLGFLTGVGISIAGLLVVLEPAELQRLQAETNSRIAQLLPQKTDSSRWWNQWRPNDGTLGRPATPAMTHPAPAESPETAGDAGPGPVSGPEPARTPEPSTPSPTRSPGDVARGATSADSEPRVLQRPRSHLFWDPFRSEPAARGFADRLSTATNVPVEVREEGPANYRVGFSYRDDAERRAHIERIESVTGLELD